MKTPAGFRLARIGSLAALLATHTAHATLEWDGSDTGSSGAQGGLGTWDMNSTANWWDGFGDTLWPDSGTDNDAVFGGTAGIVTVASVTANDLTFSTNGYTLSSSTLTLNGTTPTITTDPGVATTISSAIAGADGLTKAGAGFLRLSTSNGYAGGTVIAGGTLAIANDNHLGVVPVSAEIDNITINDGGKLLLGDGNGQPDLGANRGITLGTGIQSFVKWSRKTATIRGIITGEGGLNFDDNTAAGQDGGGGGRYQVYGANTYTGDTRITFIGIKDPGVFLNHRLALQNSTLDYNTTNATSGTDLIWFSGGVTNYTDGFTLGGLKGNKNLNLSPQNNSAKNLKIGNNDQDTSFSGVVSSSADALAGLTKIGEGTLTLTNANTYSGTTKVDAGTLKLNHNNGIQNSAFDTSGAGTLDIISLTTPTIGGLVGGTTLPLHAGITALTLNPKSGLLAAYSGDLSPITTNMPLTKSGAGTQVLSGTNSYAGVTTINAGALVFSTTSALYNGDSGSWTAPNIIVNNTGVLALGVGGAGEFTNADITNIIIPNLSNGIANNGLKAGSAIGFDTTNAGGTFTIADAIANSTGTGSGSVGLAKYGTGTLILTAVHTYTGNTTIAAGMLLIDTDGLLASGTYAGAIANNGTFTFNGSGAQTLSGVISGAGALTKSGSGVLTLSNTNTFTGQLSVENGTLSVSSINNASANGPLGNSALAAALGMTGGITGTLQYSGASGISTKKFTLAAGGTGGFQIDSSLTTLTLGATGAITGTGGLTKTGPGTLSLTGTGNNYSGGTTVSEGTFKRANANSSDDSATVTIADSGAALELNFIGTDTVDKLFIGNTQMPAGVYQAVDNPGTDDEIAQITGTGTLTVTTGTSGNAYDIWATAKGLTGLPGSGTDPASGADPDKDGRSNLTEFAFNGDPLSGSDNGMVYVLSEDSDFDSPDAQKELILTVAVRAGTPAFTGSPSPTAPQDGITYTIEGSLTLGGFATAVHVVPTPVTINGIIPLPAAGTGYVYRSFSLSGSNGLPGKGFLRAKVTQP